MHTISYLLSEAHTFNNMFKLFVSAFISTAMDHQSNEEDVWPQDAQWMFVLGKHVKHALRMPRRGRGTQRVDIVRTGREKEEIQKGNYWPEEEELTWKMREREIGRASCRERV